MEEPETQSDQTRQRSELRPVILIIITRADIGGAQMHVLQLLRELGGSYQFVLATGAEDFLTRWARKLGVEVEIMADLVRPVRFASDLRALHAAYRLIVNRQPQLVHAHSFKAGLIARLAAKVAGAPCLFTAHGWSFTPGAPLFQRTAGFLIEQVMCRLCAGVVTVSRHDFELAERWHVGSRAKRFLVLNAADDAACAGLPGRAGSTLLTIGRLTPVKNQQFLLQMLAHLPAEVRLVIVGEGPERSRLQTQVERMQLQSRVIFAGEVLDIGTFFSDAAVFVLGSRFEGLPLSILEAMSAGLPVVSTDVGGVSEAVIDGDSGYLVAAGDDRGFADRVRRLLDRPALRETMGRRGRQHYLNTFTIPRFSSQMQNIYGSILERGDHDHDRDPESP